MSFFKKKRGKKEGEDDTMTKMKCFSGNVFLSVSLSLYLRKIDISSYQRFFK